MICSRKDPEGVAYYKSVLERVKAMTDEELIRSLALGASQDSNFTSTLSMADKVQSVRTGAYQRVISRSPGTELSACVALDAMWRYLPPILFVLGTVGNLLSFIVLCQRSMIQISSYIYLATLSVVDESVILFGLLRYWIDSLIGRRIEDMSSVTCKLSQILGVSGSWLSVWLIVALTCERVLVISFPLHAHRYAATPRRAKLITLLISALFLGVNLHFVHTVDIIPASAETNDTLADASPGDKCEFLPQFEVFRRAWAWVDAIVYSYLPFSLITVMNAVILYQVYKARRSRSRLMQGRSSTLNQLSVSYSTKANGSSSSSGQQQTDTGRQLTVMLLVVSFCFLFTTTPIVVIKALPRSDPDLDSPDGYERTAAAHLLDTVATMLMYSNHAMNFFLYCATGRKFRHTLKRLCYQDDAGGRDRYNTTQIYYSSDRRPMRITHPGASQYSNTVATNVPENRETIEMRSLLPRLRPQTQ